MDKQSLGDELALITRERWQYDSTPPSAEVLELMRSAARKGFTWAIVPLDSLSNANLHWLGEQGIQLQKLVAIPAQDKPGGWRVTWLRIPAYLQPIQEPC